MKLENFMGMTFSQEINDDYIVLHIVDNDYSYFFNMIKTGLRQKFKVLSVIGDPTRILFLVPPEKQDILKEEAFLKRVYKDVYGYEFLGPDEERISNQKSLGSGYCRFDWLLVNGEKVSKNRGVQLNYCFFYDFEVSRVQDVKKKATLSSYKGHYNGKDKSVEVEGYHLEIKENNKKYLIVEITRYGLVSWNTIRDALKEYFQKRYISIHKNHNLLLLTDSGSYRERWEQLYGYTLLEDLGKHAHLVKIPGEKEPIVLDPTHFHANFHFINSRAKINLQALQNADYLKDLLDRSNNELVVNDTTYHFEEATELGIFLSSWGNGISPIHLDIRRLKKKINYNLIYISSFYPKYIFLSCYPLSYKEALELNGMEVVDLKYISNNIYLRVKQRHCICCQNEIKKIDFFADNIPPELPYKTTDWLRANSLVEGTALLCKKCADLWEDESSWGNHSPQEYEIHEFLTENISKNPCSIKVGAPYKFVNPHTNHPLFSDLDITLPNGKHYYIEYDDPSHDNPSSPASAKGFTNSTLHQFKYKKVIEGGDFIEFISHKEYNDRYLQELLIRVENMYKRNQSEI